MREADVLVVGGGPVGLAAAIEARLAGFEATVVEPRDGVIDKACGEGLMPGAIPELARLGVTPAGFPLRGVEYRDARGGARHRFGTATAFGVRRTELHAALLERATDLGVTRIAGRVTDVESSADAAIARTSAGGIRARWLLGADGLHSTVSRTLGLDAPPRGPRRFGQRQHFAVEPWTDLVEVHWTRDAELYVTPTADGTVGIAALARPGLRFRDALAGCPELVRRLAGAEPRSPIRGAGPLRRRTRARVRDRVLLVGDASGYVDALTGEGVRLGLAQARAAVEAIRADAPERYEARWREVTDDVRRLTTALVALAASPARAAVVPAARALPSAFAAAVERLAR